MATQRSLDVRVTIDECVYCAGIYPTKMAAELARDRLRRTLGSRMDRRLATANKTAVRQLAVANAAIAPVPQGRKSLV
jgi:hypothetical protein